MKQITIFKNFSQVIGSRTLPEILEAIQQGVYREEVLAVRRAVQRGDRKVADETKKQLKAFTVSGQFEAGRTMANLREYHPLVILDIDKLPTDVLEKSLKVIRVLTYTHACFLSPSGNGCKVIVMINSNQSQHRSAYLQVAQFYEKKLGVKIDQSGKDITRLCFFSYDKHLFFNPKSKVFIVKDTVVKSLPFEAKMKIEPLSNVISLPKKEKVKSGNSLQACLDFTKKKTSYVEGNRNNFVYLFASNYNRAGIAASAVVDFSLREFDLGKSEIKKTVQSVFRHHQGEHARHFQPLHRKTLFLPGNSSAAMVIRQLKNSNGSGIICETEADTLSNALKQDWGGFSDLLRKAFHFECVSYARKSADELFEIKEPRLSVALSGTPDQVYGLIPSPEDGLFSRFLFYVFSTDTDWRDVSEDEREFDLLGFYQALSEEVLEMIEWLEGHPTKVKLTKEQWKFLNDFFRKRLNQISAFNDLEASSMVKRLGVILFRILMILTAVRKFEGKKLAKNVYCSEADFIIGIKIIEVFWAHGLFMFEHLPKQKRKPFEKPKNNKQQFFDKLPKEFNRQDAIELGKSFQLSRATVDRLLRKYKKGFVDQIGHGVFSKLKGKGGS